MKQGLVKLLGSFFYDGSIYIVYAHLLEFESLFFQKCWSKKGLTKVH